MTKANANNNNNKDGQQATIINVKLNPCLVQVGLVLNDGLVLAVPACQYITTYLPTYQECNAKERLG